MKAPTLRSLEALLLVAVLTLAPWSSAQAEPIYLVKDIETTGIPFLIQLPGFLTVEVYGSFPVLEATVGELAFFRALHHEYGEELWVSDGTEAGTFLLRDVCPGPCTGDPTAGRQVGDVLLFTATDLEHGRELWRTDGTPEGTYLLQDFCPGPCSSLSENRGFGGVVYRGLNYFPVTPASGPTALWVTDGTPAGTNPLPPLCDPACISFTHPGFVYRDRLFLSGSGGTVWRTDGSLVGTEPVQPQALPGAVRGQLQGQLILVGAIGTDTALFRGDGTAEGAAPLKIFPGFFDAHSFVEHRGELYFAIGGQVWKTDGTTVGTKTVAAVYATGGIQRWKDRLLFIASPTPNGNQALWETDGTPGGTRLFPLPPGLTYRFHDEVDGQVLLSLEGAGHGFELWLTDGTLEGLQLVQDLVPGPESSFAVSYGEVGDRLFIQATRPETGYEPYAVKRRDLAPNRCLDGPDVLCLLDGRFEVRARFFDPREPSAPERSAGSLTSSEASGRFWFFDPKSSELVVKLLDGGPVNGHFWFFWGALSDVEYSVDLKDWATGTLRTFHNPRGQICGGADVEAFPAGSALASATAVPVTLPKQETRRPSSLLAGVPLAARDPEPRLTPREDGPTSRCDPGPHTLCLLDGKVEVTVDWQHPTLGTGVGRLETTDDTSAVFSFFGPGIPELVVKLLDGGPINGHYWLFSGALSDVEYRLHLREVATGRERTFTNPAGQLCGIADVEAL